jgi:hypothetical protein
MSLETFKIFELTKYDNFNHNLWGLMSSTEMVVNYKFVEIWNFDIMLEFIQIYLEKKKKFIVLHNF